MENETKDLGCAPNGCHIYRKPNKAGGWTYYSDECGVEAVVWDTCITDESTLLAVMACEHHRKWTESVIAGKRKCDQDFELEEMAATGGCFVPPDLKDALDRMETKRPKPICPECGETSDKHPRDGCLMVLGRRGWRQLGVYDG